MPGYYRNKKESVQIIGRLQSLEDKNLFGSPLQQGWKLTPKPGKDSWLNKVTEKGQNIKQFTSSSYRNEITSQRNILYIVKLDLDNLFLELKQKNIIDNKEILKMQEISKFLPSAEDLAINLYKFTRMKTKVLNPLSINLEDLTWRIKDNRIQFHTSDIQNYLIKNSLEDTYTIIGLTSLDLYANEKNNGLIGEATLDERVAICSIIRYHPLYKQKLNECNENEIIQLFEKNRDEIMKDIFISTVIVLFHECLHTMGIRHCIHFVCMMNGGHPHPKFLCPLCLRKLHIHVSLSYHDHIERYQDLLNLWLEISNCDITIKFLENRIKSLIKNK